MTTDTTASSTCAEIAAAYHAAAGEHWRTALNLRARGKNEAAERQAGFAADNLAIARRLHPDQFEDEE